MNNDDISDAEFDAFLNGTDDLSRQLRALPQPSPGTALDAAILARVEAALEQERRPQAANDAGEAPVPRLAPAFATRWRMPVGIAATLLAGVLAHQAFQASGDMRDAALMPAAPAQMESAVVAEAMAPPPPPPAEPQADMADKLVTQAQPRMAPPPARIPTPAPAPVIAAKPVPPVAEARMDAAVPVPPVSAPVQAPAPAAPAAAPVAQAAAPAPPLAPPAGAISPATDAMRPVIQDSNRYLARQAPAPAAEMNSVAERVHVTGSSRKANAKPDIAPKPAGEWIGVIEALLKAKLDEQAHAEWERFRKAYPDYPVSESLKARLETK